GYTSNFEPNIWQQDFDMNGRYFISKYMVEKNVGDTESFTLTMAEELIKRNFSVEYFTFRRGKISELLENSGVNFMTKKKYDLILANHNTCVSTLKNRGTIIQTCHGIYPKLEQPSDDADAHVSIS